MNSRKSPFIHFQGNRFAIVSALILIIISLGAVFAPWITPYAYDFQNTEVLLSGPSMEHWMGTDRLGRDLFSRILFGARVSMSVGIGTAITALILGSLYGAISGYIGGRIDNVMMRLVDVVYSLPDLLLIILITVLIGKGILGIFIALTVVSWVTIARIVRGEVLRLREQAYVEAAKAIGTSGARILFRHILPNTISILIVTLTFRIPSAILAESTLSFIGLGIAPPAASWGTLAHEGWSAMKFYPHLIIFPGLVIFVTMLSFNFLGDVLRDAFDPRSL